MYTLIYDFLSNYIVGSIPLTESIQSWLNIGTLTILTLFVIILIKFVYWCFSWCKVRNY